MLTHLRSGNHAVGRLEARGYRLIHLTTLYLSKLPVPGNKTKMSLKDTIVQWSEGVDLALSGKSKEAIAVWSAMQEPGARIYFSIASMYVVLGSIENAEKVSLQCLVQCTQRPLAAHNA